MKNKKLFAILTLVCFMFTLMPVAAFAADGAVKVSVEGAEAKATVTAKNTDNVTVSVDGNANAFYFFAVDADGNSVAMPIEETTGSSVSFKVGNVFDTAGTYKIYAVESDGNDKVATVIGDAMTEDDVKAKLLLGSSYKDERVKKAATINVKYVANSYDLAVHQVISADMDLSPAETTEINLAANGSYGAKTYAVVLTTDAGNEVAGATVKISHNGVNVAKATVTNEDGIGYFQVYGTVVGEFKLELSYADVEVVIPVSVSNVAPTEVSVVAEPTAPVDVNEASTAFGIGFKLVDGNGNVLDSDADLLDEYGAKQYKLAVVGPAASTVKATDIYLAWDSTNEYYEIGGISADSELAEGTYTFTVSLESGKSASASVKVKEFDEPVALKMMYGAKTVDTVAGIGDTVSLKSLKYVDADGVTKDATGDITTDVKLSVSGKAVASFDDTDGTLVIREDDRYIGETITVVAVYDETLVAKANIKVVDEAVTLQYAGGDVQAATNNTLKFYVVNADGDVIALDKKAGTVTSATVVVVDKPDNAYVAASVTNPTAVSSAVAVSFTPSVVGEYELMVVVEYTDVNESNVDITRSVTGTAVINVGGLETFKDVVVVSINADKIIVNDEVKAIPAPAVIKDSRTFVPFRALAEAFGATVDYDFATAAVTAELNGVKVVMMNGDKAYTVNGVEKVADVAPYLNVEASTTMVPVSFVAKAFGINYQCIYAEDGTVADVLFTK